MIRPIVLWGAEVLEKTSEPIKNITDAEIKLVEDMIETMYKAPGVGLAAPQVGVSKRIMVTDATGGERKESRVAAARALPPASADQHNKPDSCQARVEPSVLVSSQGVA